MAAKCCLSFLYLDHDGDGGNVDGDEGEDDGESFDLYLSWLFDDII